jgi:hypothetical protein
MIILNFNTTTKTAKVYWVDGSQNMINPTIIQVFNEVPTVQVRTEGFYEIMQDKPNNGNRVPVYRLPIQNTLMQIEK